MGCPATDPRRLPAVYNTMCMHSEANSGDQILGRDIRPPHDVAKKMALAQAVQLLLPDDIRTEIHLLGG